MIFLQAFLLWLAILFGCAATKNHLERRPGQGVGWILSFTCIFLFLFLWK